MPTTSASWWCDNYSSSTYTAVGVPASRMLRLSLLLRQKRRDSKNKEEPLCEIGPIQWGCYYSHILVLYVLQAQLAAAVLQCCCAAATAVCVGLSRVCIGYHSQPGTRVRICYFWSTAIHTGDRILLMVETTFTVCLFVCLMYVATRYLVCVVTGQHKDHWLGA